MSDRFQAVMPLPKVGDMVKLRPEWNSIKAAHPFNKSEHYRVVETNPPGADSREGGVKVEGDANFRRLSCFEPAGGPW